MWNIETSINPQSETKERWISISACYFCTFIMFCQQSCYWTSLWPYMSQVDPTVTESYVGFVVAAYSIGQGLSAPFFGLWSNRTMNTRRPILYATCVNIIGNLVIALIEVFPPEKRHHVFLAARLLCGIGTGCTGTAAAYVAMATYESERGRAMGIQSAMVSLAILGGPGIAALMSPIGYPGYRIGSYIRVDMYTSIAYFLILLSFLLLFIMVFAFRKEYYVSLREKHSDAKNTAKPLNLRAVLTCIFMRFTMLFAAGCDESIASAFTMAMFNWSRKQAVLYNSLINMCGGVVGFTLNITTGHVLLRYLRERSLLLCGIFALLFFYVISYSYPTILPTLEYVADQNSTRNGCYYEWCHYTTRIRLWQFLLAYLSFHISIPVAFTSNDVLYSKVLGQRRQGFLQGIFMGSGNVATAVSPILISHMFESYGPRLAWITAGSVGVSCLINLLLNYQYMLPESELRLKESSTNDTEAPLMDPDRQLDSD